MTDRATVQDVLPPSIHPDTGKPYEWAGAGDWRKLPTLPNMVLTLWRSLAEPVEAPRAARRPTRAGAIPEGGRNAQLTSLAGTMRRRGMEHAAIEAALTVRERSKVPAAAAGCTRCGQLRHLSPLRARAARARSMAGTASLDREAAQAEPYPLDALPGEIGASGARVSSLRAAAGGAGGVIRTGRGVVGGARIGGRGAR